MSITRRIAVMFGIAVGLACAVPATAQDSIDVDVVGGRVYLFAKSRPTRINQLVGYGITPGSSVSLRCMSHGCPLEPVNGEVDETGIADASPWIRRHELPAGAILNMTIRNNDNGYKKILRYVVRSDRLSPFKFTCVDPSGAAVSCTVRCGANATAPPDRCQDVGGIIEATGDFVGLRTKGARTRFRALNIHNIPEGATLVAFCIGRDCPVGIVARYFKHGASDFSLARPFGGRSYKPGMRLEGWLIKANTVGVVARITMRKGRRPKIENLCVLPTDTTPRRCPT